MMLARVATIIVALQQCDHNRNGVMAFKAPLLCNVCIYEVKTLISSDHPHGGQKEIISNYLMNAVIK